MGRGPHCLSDERMDHILCQLDREMTVQVFLMGRGMTVNVRWVEQSGRLRNDAENQVGERDDIACQTGGKTPLHIRWTEWWQCFMCNRQRDDSACQIDGGMTVNIRWAEEWQCMSDGRRAEGMTVNINWKEEWGVHIRWPMDGSASQMGAGEKKVHVRWAE